MCIKSGRHQRGLTLIELIMFIVIVSVALAGVLTVFNVTTRFSADPMIQKQMLSLAEAVLEEVQMQPFTWCDPDDPNATTAMKYADCSTQTIINPNPPPATVTGVMAQNSADAKSGESRGSNTVPLDNVLDYNGETISSSISTSASTAAPAGYSASVTVSPVSNLGPAGAQISTADAVLLITVTVTHGTDSIVLHGYRTRYSPNALP